MAHVPSPPRAGGSDVFAELAEVRGGVRLARSFPSNALDGFSSEDNVLHVLLHRRGLFPVFSLLAGRDPAERWASGGVWLPGGPAVERKGNDSEDFGVFRKCRKQLKRKQLKTCPPQE